MKRVNSKSIKISDEIEKQAKRGVIVFFVQLFPFCAHLYNSKHLKYLSYENNTLISDSIYLLSFVLYK